jgi:ABC-type transporter Mla subunit MlaD
MPDNSSTELALIKLLSEQLADVRALSARIEHLSEHLGRLEHNTQHRHQQIMTALETLTASADALTAADTDLTGAINDAITRIGSPSATDAQLLSIAGIIDHNTEVVKNQTAALRAALNPTPPPTPAP